MLPIINLSSNVFFCILTLLLVITSAIDYIQVNDTHWESIGEFKPINNVSYGYIRLQRALRMEFKLIFHDKTSPNDWENVFRVGYDTSGNNGNVQCDGGASRYPALFVHQTQDVLLFYASDEAQCWRQIGEYTPIKEQLYYIIIEFNQTWVYISVTNQDTQSIDIVTDEPRKDYTDYNSINNKMNIWISELGTAPPANVTIYDIIIHTWNPSTPLPTISPTYTPTTYIPTYTPTTYAPTRNPTEYPTEYPTTIPTNQPTIQPTPTVRPTHSPTHKPTIAPTIGPTTTRPSITPTINPTVIPSTQSTVSITTEYPDTTFITSKYPTIATTSTSTSTTTYNIRLDTSTTAGGVGTTSYTNAPNTKEDDEPFYRHWFSDFTIFLVVVVVFSGVIVLCITLLCVWIFCCRKRNPDGHEQITGVDPNEPGDADNNAADKKIFNKMLTRIADELYTNPINGNQNSNSNHNNNVGTGDNNNNNNNMFLNEHSMSSDMSDMYINNRATVTTRTNAGDDYPAITPLSVNPLHPINDDNDNENDDDIYAIVQKSGNSPFSFKNKLKSLNRISLSQSHHDLLNNSQKISYEKVNINKNQLLSTNHLPKTLQHVITGELSIQDDNDEDIDICANPHLHPNPNPHVPSAITYSASPNNVIDIKSNSQMVYNNKNSNNNDDDEKVFDNYSTNTGNTGNTRFSNNIDEELYGIGGNSNGGPLFNKGLPKLNDNNTSDNQSLYGKGSINMTTYSSNVEGDYAWITETLKQCDENDWQIYLNNFRAHKVNENRLNQLSDDDWKMLLPDIGPRNEFKELWRAKCVLSV